VCAVLGQVADYDLALDQIDHECLGSLADGLAWILMVRHLGLGHALQPVVDSVGYDGVIVEHVGSAGRALASAAGKATVGTADATSG
jgi:hypothetical protein